MSVFQPRVGDVVRFTFGTQQLRGRVTELRDNIGVNGRALLRVITPALQEFELSRDDVEIVSRVGQRITRRRR